MIRRTRRSLDIAVDARHTQYQRMFQAEAVDGPADLVIAGDEATVAEGLDRYANAGATNVPSRSSPGTTREHDRTHASSGGLRATATGDTHTRSEGAESQELVA
jgi:hypothetical protein